MLQDPYVVVKFGEQTCKTLHDEGGGVDPEWDILNNNTMTFDLSSAGIDRGNAKFNMQLSVEVWSKGTVLADQRIGRVMLNLVDVVMDGMLDSPQWSGLDSGGAVQFTISCRRFSIQNLNVKLKKYPQGFGITFKEAFWSGNQMMGCTVVKFADNDAGARLQQAGSLRVGDRLMSVGEHSVARDPWQEAIRRLTSVLTNESIVLGISRIVIGIARHNPLGNSFALQERAGRVAVVAQARQLKIEAAMQKAEEMALEDNPQDVLDLSVDKRDSVWNFQYEQDRVQTGEPQISELKPAAMIQMPTLNIQVKAHCCKSIRNVQLIGSQVRIGPYLRCVCIEVSCLSDAPISCLFLSFSRRAHIALPFWGI
jgi:hypothetical protein